MIQKINEIKNIRHPASDAIDKKIALLETIFNIVLTIVDALGFIIAIVVSTGLSGYIDNLKNGYEDRIVDIPFNILGYSIEIESDSFLAFPFIIFVYIIIIFLLISLLIIAIKTFTISILRSKTCMLNSLYRNEALTELLITSGCNSQNQAKNPDNQCNLNDYS